MTDITGILADEADGLLYHRCRGIPKELLHLPGPDFVDRIVEGSDRKRAGGMGLITGRKAFQKPMDEGIALLNAVQDVYLSAEVTIA